MSFPLVWGIKFRYRGFVTFLVREGFNKKKSDNYHFWGGGGGVSEGHLSLFFWSKNDF